MVVMSFCSDMPAVSFFQPFARARSWQLACSTPSSITLAPPSSFSIQKQRGCRVVTVDVDFLHAFARARVDAAQCNVHALLGALRADRRNCASTLRRIACEQCE